MNGTVSLAARRKRTSLTGDVDARIVERALEGDSQAFEEVYVSLRGSIYNFAYRMLGVRATAEDITQEVFIFLIKQPNKYSPERGSLRSFLCGIARNKILHYLRNGKKTGRSLELIDEDEPPQNAPDPLRVLLEKEFVLVVERSLLMLPPHQREAVILRELQGLSYEEIGIIVGENINTVKSRVHRARSTLAASLARYLGTERKVI